MTRQRLKDLATLGRRKGRDRLGLVLVEGLRSVAAALDAGAPLAEALVAAGRAEDPAVSALAGRLRAAGVAVHAVPTKSLERVGDARTSQGVVAVARRFVRERLPAGVADGVVVLDGVQDPGNVGTLVRAASWFGARAVLLDARSADPEAPKVVRASMGGVWDVPLVRVTQLPDALAELRAGGVALWGADLGGTPAARWAPGGPAALVLGSEAHGLSAEVRALLDGTVAIGRGAGAGRGVESLNVAVSGGVLLHAWRVAREA